MHYGVAIIRATQQHTNKKIIEILIQKT
uniref:Uncharacterized protein n=1 Tax=Rhizophora mucronata TaxID=61149 RepID=A0A2P2PW31_RHIMU